ncbi:hypothetical protein [Streptomyces anandii]|uniref:Uncharacterized protein n=1 Tax=Streptomyces anandii TaxID=285454 RepID=A0ABW6H4Y9_9ACTN
MADFLLPRSLLVMGGDRCAVGALFESVADRRAGFLERVGHLFDLVVEALSASGARAVTARSSRRPELQSAL